MIPRENSFSTLQTSTNALRFIGKENLKSNRLLNSSRCAHCFAPKTNDSFTRFCTECGLPWQKLTGQPPEIHSVIDNLLLLFNLFICYSASSKFVRTVKQQFHLILMFALFVKHPLDLNNPFDRKRHLRSIEQFNTYLNKFHFFPLRLDFFVHNVNLRIQHIYGNVTFVRVVLCLRLFQ